MNHFDHNSKKERKRMPTPNFIVLCFPFTPLSLYVFVFPLPFSHSVFTFPPVFTFSPFSPLVESVCVRVCVCVLNVKKNERKSEGKEFGVKREKGVIRKREWKEEE
jgi:hypothetical protein